MHETVNDIGLWISSCCGLQNQLCAKEGQEGTIGNAEGNPSHLISFLQNYINPWKPSLMVYESSEVAGELGGLVSLASWESQLLLCQELPY